MVENDPGSEAYELLDSGDGRVLEKTAASSLLKPVMPVVEKKTGGR